MAKFFTWIEEAFTEPAAVPPPLRRYIRELWLEGAKPEVLAEIFHMPLEWIEEFVRHDPPPPTIN